MGDYAPTTMLRKPKHDVVYETDSFADVKISTVGKVEFCARCGMLKHPFHICKASA